MTDEPVWYSTQNGLTRTRSPTGMPVIAELEDVQDVVPAVRAALDDALQDPPSRDREQRPAGARPPHTRHRDR